MEIRQENGLLRDLPWWNTVENDEALVDPAFGKTYHDFRDKRISPERPDPPIEELLMLTSRFLTMAPEEIKGRSTKPEIAKARMIFAVLAVERYGKRNVDVADLLGKNPCSISRWLAQARNWSADPATDEILKQLDGYIISSQPCCKPIGDTLLQPLDSAKL
jgi:hypothetical protein